MSRSTPILIIGFNRPESLRTLLQSLKPYNPALLLVCIDGPRLGNPIDIDLVHQCRQLVNGISWVRQIETLFRDTNIGLRASVVDAVNRATDKYGRVIVIEDDVEIGPNFLPYMETMLKVFEDDDSVAHINGYNVIPRRRLTEPDETSRFTRYVESFAWATWQRAWRSYDDSMAWANLASLRNLADLLGSRSAAIRWKLNFADVASQRIDSWAYRWMASIWANDMKILSPNENLVRYTGWENGTHTSRAAKWTELPVVPKRDEFIESLDFCGEIDRRADRWLGRSVFSETPLGVLEGLGISALLKLKNVRPH